MRGLATKCLDVRRIYVGFSLAVDIVCTLACPGLILVHLGLLSDI